jgi:hypothetical protein
MHSPRDNQILGTELHMGSFSVWHWLVLLVVFAPFAAIIYVAVSRVRAEQRAGTGITPGLKGWLYILAAGQWLGLLKTLGTLGRYVNDPGTTASATAFPALAAVDLSVFGVNIALIATTLWMMMNKARTFPKLYKALCVWLVVALPVNGLLAQAVLSLYYGRPELGVHIWAAVFEPESIGAVLGAVIVAVPWWIYLGRSRRVAVTFTH